MRGKMHALLLDLPQTREGKYLEPAGVRQDRPIPRHELMQAAELLDHFIAWTKVQVICVGQLDLRPNLLQIRRAQRALDRALRADVHKDRRLHRPVRTRKDAPPRVSLFFNDLKHPSPPL